MIQHVSVVSWANTHKHSLPCGNIYQIQLSECTYWRSVSLSHLLLFPPSTHTHTPMWSCEALSLSLCCSSQQLVLYVFTDFNAHTHTSTNTQKEPRTSALQGSNTWLIFFGVYAHAHFLPVSFGLMCMRAVMCFYSLAYAGVFVRLCVAASCRNVLTVCA